jgi:hypothetical protein
MGDRRVIAHILDKPNRHHRNMEGFFPKLYRVDLLPLHFGPKFIEFFENYRVAFVRPPHRGVLCFRFSQRLSHSGEDVFSAVVGHGCTP